MKKALSFAAILLILTSAFTCGKEDTENRLTKGIIAGYHKCTDFENGGVVFGIYIVTNKQDTLLSYNIPHETLSSLLGGFDIENCTQGSLYFSRDIPPVIFDYREAEEHEIVTIFCAQNAFLPGFPMGNAKQVIITKINNHEKK
jgi:hypothetical protein